MLSARETELLFAKVRKLAGLGTTVLYISHRIEEIFEISDRVVVLKDGAAVLDEATATLDRDRLIRAMVGRSLAAIYPCATQIPARSFSNAAPSPRRGIFHDVSFDIRAGEIVGMFGLVGSGRTDVARALFGAAPATSGEILIDGKIGQHLYPPGCHRPWHCARHRGPQARRSGPRSDRDRQWRPRFDGRGIARWHSRSRRTSENRRRQARRARGQATRPLRLARRYSGGNQQKIVLAKWLLVENVRLFIFDEPTRGVDIATKVEIYRMIAELAQSGAAVLLISSEMPEVLGMSDRLIVMRAGRIVAELARQDFSMETVFAHAAGVEHGRLTA